MIVHAFSRYILFKRITITNFYELYYIIKDKLKTVEYMNNIIKMVPTDIYLHLFKKYNIMNLTCRHYVYYNL